MLGINAFGPAAKAVGCCLVAANLEKTQSLVVILPNTQLSCETVSFAAPASGKLDGSQSKQSLIVFAVHC